jgi:hypothetical protein
MNPTIVLSCDEPNTTSAVLAGRIPDVQIYIIKSLRYVFNPMTPLTCFRWLGSEIPRTLEGSELRLWLLSAHPCNQMAAGLYKSIDRAKQLIETDCRKEICKKYTDLSNRTAVLMYSIHTL